MPTSRKQTSFMARETEFDRDDLEFTMFNVESPGSATPEPMDDESEDMDTPRQPSFIKRANKRALRSPSPIVSDIDDTKPIEVPAKRVFPLRSRGKLPDPQTKQREGRQSSGSESEFAADDTPSKKPSLVKTRAQTKNKAQPKNKEWEVEKIVDSRIEAGTNRHFYKVRWVGFSSKEDTWEPKINLGNCRAALEAFERSQG